MQHEILDMKLNISEYLFRMMHLIDIPVELTTLKNKYTKSVVLRNVEYKNTQGKVREDDNDIYCGLLWDLHVQKECGIWDAFG